MRVKNMTSPRTGREVPKGFKQHPVYQSYYISKNGQVWSTKRNRLIVPYKMKNGYLSIRLGKYSVSQLVHRLVLETFIGFCPDGMESCHNNGMRDDNRLSNLRWDTLSNNQKDRIKHKTDNRGENYGAIKITKKDVDLIFNNYWDGAYSQYELAEQFGVSQSHISQIVNKKQWFYNN